MFRSRATGKAGNAEQERRCEAHFADRGFRTESISRLDYRVWGIEVDPTTGLITNHAARDLGPGYMCSIAPPQEAVAGFQTYTNIQFPGLPELELEGQCRPTATRNNGELFFSCKLEILPDATKGIYGGFVSTNSVLNPLDADGWPTGSVWTGYLVEEAP
jgi:hypothetical protein